MENFDTYKIEIPEPIAIKFLNGDYIRVGKPSAKYDANPSTGGLLGNSMGEI